MRITTSFIICLAALLLWELPAQAETRYVTDQLYLTLRSDKSGQYKIVKTLKTDTPVEVLEEGDDEFLKVRTMDGKTGYVMKQYITEEKPKSMIISRLKNENESANRKIENLKTKVDKLLNEISTKKEEYSSGLTEISATTESLKTQLAASRDELNEIKERYDELRRQSGNLDEILNERNELREKNTSLTDQVRKLENRNSKLKNLAMLRWFLAGGGVFLVGWLIGRTPKRKQKIRW